MADKLIERRTVITHRWICTNKELCEQLDEQIRVVQDNLIHLSSFVEKGEINGITCLVFDARLSYMLDGLKKQRKELWRRVPRKEVIETEIDAADVVVQDEAKVVVEASHANS